MSQNLQENTCAGISFLINLQAVSVQLYEIKSRIYHVMKSYSATYANMLVYGSVFLLFFNVASKYLLAFALSCSWLWYKSNLSAKQGFLKETKNRFQGM